MCCLLFKTFKICLILTKNDTLSSKQVGSQASRQVIRRLAWIKPVCISIKSVPALKGLSIFCDPWTFTSDLGKQVHIFFWRNTFWIFCSKKQSVDWLSKTVGSCSAPYTIMLTF